MALRAAGGDVKQNSCCERGTAVPQIKNRISVPSIDFTWGVLQKALETATHKKICTILFIATLKRQLFLNGYIDE